MERVSNTLPVARQFDRPLRITRPKPGGHSDDSVSIEAGKVLGRPPGPHNRVIERDSSRRRSREHLWSREVCLVKLL